MKSAGKARNNGLYRHIRTSKEIIRNLLNDYINYIITCCRSDVDDFLTIFIVLYVSSLSILQILIFRHDNNFSSKTIL